MFSALSYNHGSLADKISVFIAICPITNIKYSAPPAGTLKKAEVDGLTALANINGIYELMGPNWINVEQTVCAVFPCQAFTEMIGMNLAPWNNPVTTDIANYRTSEASTKQAVHYGQT
jgi:hypothetical protein